MPRSLSVTLAAALALAASAASAKREAALEDFCVSGEEASCRARAMDAFFAALKKISDGEAKAQARVIHYGDSIIAADYISSTVREKLQAELGDAGRGFAFAALPTNFHALAEVTQKASKGWTIKRLPDPKPKDRLMGFAGASFASKTKGARLSFSTKKSISRVEVYYLAQPGGGELSVSADGELLETLSTAGDKAAPAWKAFTLTDGPHDLSLEVLGTGEVRLFGVALERESAGVIYDNAGEVSGATAHLLEIDADHFSSELGHRAPSLVVIEYGTNEVNYTSTSAAGLAEYQETLTAVFKKVRAAAPKASCLVVSPLDSAQPSEDDPTKLVSKPAIPKLIKAQREAAKAAGCAYLDVYAALGGKGTAVTWAEKGLLGEDLSHPSPGGARIVGKLIYEALSRGFADYRAR
jgi:lysophospholipase L1-like esterase